MNMVQLVALHVAFVNLMHEPVFFHPELHPGSTSVATFFRTRGVIETMGHATNQSMQQVVQAILPKFSAGKHKLKFTRFGLTQIL